MCKCFATQLWLVIVGVGLCVGTAQANTDSELRSAYLGPSVWSEDLSAPEVNDQLKAHFAEVINRLESKNASGLLTALLRAEATSLKRWSETDRRTALIYLAKNRQRQIKRLRDYMNRGRFPLNEGQSPKAVPIFVDRHNTHCAVGHLMHRDGKDADVSQIVQENNLVRIRNVHGGNVVQWIRSSGLTKEEAAMIQPGYPIPLDATFSQLPNSVPVVQRNGFTLSDFSATNAVFDATLPLGFQNDPTSIDPIFQQGITAVGNSQTFSRPSFAGSDNHGVLFGNAGDQLGMYSFSGNGPSNLDSWLYVGSDTGFSPTAFVGDNLLLTGSPNAEIVEINYKVRSDLGNFSRVAFTLRGAGSSLDTDLSQDAAIAVLSQIYSGSSNQLLGEALFFGGRLGGGSASFNFNNESQTLSVNEDFLQFKTTALVVGSGAVSSFFNEFEVSAVPEPTGGAVVAFLLGTVVVCRRKRGLSAN